MLWQQCRAKKKKIPIIIYLYFQGRLGQFGGENPFNFANIIKHLEWNVNVSVSHRCCGNDLLRDHPQSVHHRDIAQPPSYTQSRVAVLEKKRDQESSTRRICLDCWRYASLCALTYHSDGVGLGTVLQEHINDVRVSLLSRLVKRSVSILKVTDSNT